MSHTFRSHPLPEDAEAVRRIVSSSGYFSVSETDVAVELVQEALARGEEISGYSFEFVELDGDVVGYTCFGLIPCTVSSYDLYWIAVDASRRGTGLGRILLERTEDRIRAMGGTRVYIETSGRPQYESTRGFYLRCGYHEEARFTDFYAPGDPKVVYVKALGS